MNEKENMEKMNPDLQDIEQSGFDPETDVTSTEGSDVAANEKIYVPYEEEAPYEESPENVMNLGHIGSLDELDESMAGEEEEEEDDDDKKPFISARMIKIGALMMLTTVVFILGIIAWFSMSKEVGNQGMGISVAGPTFEVTTLTGSEGIFKDPYHIKVHDDSALYWTMTPTNNLINYTSATYDENNELVDPGDQGLHPGT
ncbi:MAG: hypothetical protein K6E28_02035, partial [Eubacterium sp.]|nr:hypothetical protein [Eubacterium sp.]